MGDDQDDAGVEQLGWPVGRRNTWPYVAGTMKVLGATIWGYEGGDANAAAWSGLSKHNYCYCFDEDGNLSRPPTDIGAEVREGLR